MYSPKCFETHLSSFLRASLTIEAAIALPIFIFMMFLLIFPLRVMEEERRIQNYMEKLGRQMVMLKYVEQTGAELVGADSTELTGEIIGGIEEGTALTLIMSKAAGCKSIKNAGFGADTSVFSGDSDKGEDMFYAELQYSLGMPEFFFGLPDVSKSLVVSRRAWTGSDGGRGRDRYSAYDDETSEDDDRTVYLGKTSKVYHEDPNCHYLSNVMLSSDVSAMDSLRNESGGKYHACPSCRPQSSGTVYYFESGTAYHASESCKAITAYSRAVKLSELGDMRPCSYCGGEH